ncbi:hypothetical protein PTKIN_Ptkin06aG0187200 [Pterospermum kingtungense]
MRAFTISFVGLLVALAATHISFCDGNSNVHCIESERQALLKFKQDLITDPSNRLSSWVEVEGEDCCEWIGVFCNNLTGHVYKLHLGLLPPDDDAPDAEWDAYYLTKLRGKINPFLLHLKHLSFLDLSNNDFGGEIPEFIGSLMSLTYLNLSGAYFQGAIPQRLGNLSKLQYLDLGHNYGLQAKTLQWVSGLSALRYLDLTWANLSNSTDWLQLTSRLPSLVELHLSQCNLNHDSSPISVNYTSLAVLDLSSNMMFSSVPTWIFSLPSLVSIDISDNSMEGLPPNGFNSLSSWSIQNWLSNLTRLERLESLNVASNNLHGQLTDKIGQFKSLSYLSLFGNSISGPIPFSIGKLSLLKALDVSNNQLNGSLPESLGQLGNLEHLDVSNNMLEGNISEMLFTNLTRLRILKASNNNMLTFKPNPSWVPPFHCQHIGLGKWQLGPQFPQWLQSQKNLSSIDVSDAGISGVVPTWFWNLSTEFSNVNISHNQLMGGISYLPVISIVDLSSNQFTGPLPQSSSHLEYLILSRNLFSGSLSNFLCNSSTKLEDLTILDVESNHLSGEIPDCWKNLGLLSVLNLGNNNLSGKVPRSLGSMGGILSLDLRNNSLFGEIPSALQHLTYMLLLDLSGNQFTGSIPTWIGYNLSNLVILNLRSNKLQGHIPDQICALDSLQVLDLGYNNISGTIPKCFSNLTAMATKPLEKYLRFLPYSFWPVPRLGTTLVMRGREDEYSTTLGLVTSIDLSVNSITGELYAELGNLTRLRSLNMSGNLLTGKIPETVGNMEWLESLDLSMNRLRGEIPSSLSKLNFLNHLNLSYNSLTGQIPSGTQLQSFDMFSYIGNHLCGPPVTANCIRNGNVTNGGSNERRKRFKVNWLYVSIVLGFAMGFWGVVAPLFLSKSWRFAYYKKLERIGDKLYVFCATIAR